MSETKHLVFKLQGEGGLANVVKYGGKQKKNKKKKKLRLTRIALTLKATRLNFMNLRLLKLLIMRTSLSKSRAVHRTALPCLPLDLK